MPKRMPRSNKSKSRRRWKDGRRLKTEILPTMPNSGHAAVMWSCWFNSELTKDELSVFDVTASQIAPETGLSERQVKRIIQDLTSKGLLAVRRNGHNHGGRGIGAERCITWRPYPNGKGDMGDTLSEEDRE